MEGGGDRNRDHDTAETSNRDEAVSPRKAPWTLIGRWTCNQEKKRTVDVMIAYKSYARRHDREVDHKIMLGSVEFAFVPTLCWEESVEEKRDGCQTCLPQAL
ncbi:hypothetical protein OPV22_000119 [Ensete ventricosum]|uniref:Uncharacterized protein n=1 Tax=Ensete ventricosum TaxID=4639 RepID=A0AAV8RNQ3_ENSVE|nr:hypothetical protein OPV22_000119 [Ensete ventricosum]